MSESAFFKRVGSQASNSGGRPGRPSHASIYLDGEELFGTPQKGMWAVKGGSYFWAAPETVTTLPAGVYGCRRSDDTFVLEKRTIAMDELVFLPDTAISGVLAEFERFWNLRERFRDHGFLHKRGILLWGPPGSGKTSGIMQMGHHVITGSGGIVVQIEAPDVAAACLWMLRKIEPDRPIVAILEDIDALVQRYGEAEYLALLDGETQVDGICYVATTNYPEKLDARFMERPSRFDLIAYVGMPDAVARTTYLRAKDPDMTAGEMAEAVGGSEGLSLAHLRELIVLVRAFGYSISGALKRLRSKERPHSEKPPAKAKALAA